METVKIETEYIKLDQLLKWAGWVDSGVEAKNIILNGEVKVNGEKEIRRGKKIRSGDSVEAKGKMMKVE